MKRSAMLRAGVVACVSMSMTLIGLPAHAAPKAPAPSGPEVIATGLLNPRGVAIANDGSIYVAESGAGGSKMVTALSEGEEADVCVGQTGAVTRIWKGQQTRLARFASYASAVLDAAGNSTCKGAGEGATGPSDVAVNGLGNLTVVMGLGGNADTRATMESTGFKGFGTLQSLLPNGKTSVLADVTAHEVRYNPDDGEVDSNPYGVAIVGGDRLVADAGGNDLVRIRANGAVSTAAVFPDLAPAPFPALSCAAHLPPDAFPPAGAPISAQAVATSVAQGPDGALYVGILSGFPFSQDNARIYRIDPKTGAVSQFGPNLNHVVGIAFGPDGSLYAAEMTTDSLLEAMVCGTGAPGAIVKVTKNSKTVVAGGLPLVGGLAIDKSGSAYVSVFSVLPGGGQLWKVKL